MASWLVLNLCISTIVGNLHPIKKSVQIGDVVTGERVQYDTQIGNLFGKPGEGYYMEVDIGTPPQTV